MKTNNDKTMKTKEEKFFKDGCDKKTKSNNSKSKRKKHRNWTKDYLNDYVTEEDYYN